MIHLEPIAITSATSTAGGDATYPASNLLLDPAETYARSAEDVTTWKVSVVLTGPVSSLCVLGVVADSLTLTVGGSAPAGLTEETIDDPIIVGRTSYWWTFTERTGAQTFVLTFTRDLADQVARAGVVRAGKIYNTDGVLYPLDEGVDDPTVVLQMADGSLYHGPQLRTVRTFGVTVRAAKADIATLCDSCRRTGGRTTMWHLAPEWGDRYFVYGRLAAQPQANHAWPTVSTASLAVREVV